MRAFHLSFLFLMLVSSFSSAQANNKFTDSKLEAYLNTHKKGVIYIVSPHMYLSLKGLPEYRALAQKQGVQFLALLEPITNTRVNALKMDLSELAVLNSAKLINLDATQHFPAFIFFKEGKLIGRFNPGYDAPEKFEQRLKKVFGK